MYAPIRHKLANALKNWHPSDPSAKMILQPWQRVFKPGHMEAFIAKNILPKLGMALAEFVINPNQQQMGKSNTYFHPISLHSALPVVWIIRGKPLVLTALGFWYGWLVFVLLCFVKPNLYLLKKLCFPLQRSWKNWQKVYKYLDDPVRSTLAENLTTSWLGEQSKGNPNQQTCPGLVTSNFLPHLPSNFTEI